MGVQYLRGVIDNVSFPARNTFIRACCHPASPCRPRSPKTPSHCSLLRALVVCPHSCCHFHRPREVCASILLMCAYYPFFYRITLQASPAAAAVAAVAARHVVMRRYAFVAVRAYSTAQHSVALLVRITLHSTTQRCSYA